jgi:hypothetical protein
VAAVAAMAISLLLTSAKPTQAEPYPFGSEGFLNMRGGNNTSFWSFQNDLGTSNGLPLGGSCNERPNSGLGVFIAELTPGEFPAIINGLTVFVDNHQFVSPDTVDISGTPFTTTLTSGPVSISGLNTSVQYHVSRTDDTLRTFISLNNPTTDSITVPVTVATNLAADIRLPTGIQIINTSSGDTTFTTSDSYIITDDGSTVGGAPTVTSVVAGGWGSPQAQPSAVSDTGYCGHPKGVLVTYDVTVPAGQTRSVLLFNQLNTTPTEATEEVGVFNDNLTLAATTDFLEGLSTADLARVVNFDFDSRAPKVIATFPRDGGEIDFLTERTRGPARYIWAEFSEEMYERDVAEAINVYKEGSDTPIDSIRGYDPRKRMVFFYPPYDTPLEQGVTYKAVVSTEAMDAEGTRLDQNPDIEGDQNMSWTFTVK